MNVVVISSMPQDSSLKEVSIEGNVTHYRFATKPVYSLIDFGKKSLTSRYLWQVFNAWNFHSYKKIQKYLAAEKPDIVHTHNFKALSPSIFSAISSGSFLQVHTVHDYNLVSPWSNLMRRNELIKRFNIQDKSYMKYMQLITRHIDVCVFPSAFAMRFHRQLGFFKTANSKVLNNGIPLNGKIHPKSYDTINVLYVGSLTTYKGVHVLLSAFKRCREVNLRLNVVGTGPNLDYLKKDAQNDSRIVFHGRLTDEALEDLYQKSSFLVIPSLWYEVLPVVIQESMAHGMPVIGSAIGGIRDLIIDGYNGYCFTPGDITGLSRTITELACSPEKISELGKNCYNFVGNFSMINHTKELIHIYQTLLN